MRTAERTCGCGHVEGKHSVRGCNGKHAGGIPCGCQRFVGRRGQEVVTKIKGDAEPTVTK